MVSVEESGYRFFEDQYMTLNVSLCENINHGRFYMSMPKFIKSTYPEMTNDRVKEKVSYFKRSSRGLKLAEFYEIDVLYYLKASGSAELIGSYIYAEAFPIFASTVKKRYETVALKYIYAIERNRFRLVVEKLTDERNMANDERDNAVHQKNAAIAGFQEVANDFEDEIQQAQASIANANNQLVNTLSRLRTYKALVQFSQSDNSYSVSEKKTA